MFTHKFPLYTGGVYYVLHMALLISKSFRTKPCIDVGGGAST